MMSRLPPQLRARLLLLLTVVAAVGASLAFDPLRDALRERADRALLERLATEDPRPVLDEILAREPLPRRQALIADPRLAEALAGWVRAEGGDGFERRLEALELREPTLRRRVLDDPASQATVVTREERRALEAFDPATGRLEIEQARVAVERIDALYPDAGLTDPLEAELETRRALAVTEHERRYLELLEKGTVLPAGTGAGRDLETVHHTLARLAPAHPRLRDPATAARLSALARDVLPDDPDRAQAIVALGLRLAPRHPDLAALASDLEQARDEARIAAARSRLAAHAPEELADYQEIADAMVTLALEAPGDPAWRDTAWALRQVLESEIVATLDTAGTDAAEVLLLDFARLLEVPTLRTLRERLDAAAPPTTASDTRRREARQARVEHINALLAAPTLNRDWERAFLVAWREYLALDRGSSAGETVVGALLPRLYRDRGLEVLEREGPEAAAAVLARARLFTPKAKPLEELAAAIAARR
jgi:hypothetical protein